MSDKLFVVGPYKTATSTLTGMLNCCDKIYLEYEIFENENYQSIFIEKYPETREIIEAGNITGLYDYLSGFCGENVLFVGEKIATLDNNIFSRLEGKILFTIRDIRSWLYKKKSLESLMVSDTTWPYDFVRKYMIMFLSSFKVNCFRVRMEDLLFGDYKLNISQIGDFLEINNLYTEIGEWHKQIGRWKQNEKNESEWWKKHPSSLIYPPVVENVPKIKPDADLWRVVLPIFDKYYSSLNNVFSVKEIDEDLRLVGEIGRKYNCVLDDLYGMRSI